MQDSLGADAWVLADICWTLCATLLHLHSTLMLSLPFMHTASEGHGSRGARRKKQGWRLALKPGLLCLTSSLLGQLG